MGGGVAPRQKGRLRHQGEEGSEKKRDEDDTRNRHMPTKRKDRENRRTAIFNGKAKTMKKSQGCPGGTMNATYFGLNGGDAS